MRSTFANRTDKPKIKKRKRRPIGYIPFDWVKEPCDISDEEQEAQRQEYKITN